MVWTYAYARLLHGEALEVTCTVPGTYWRKRKDALLRTGRPLPHTMRACHEQVHLLQNRGLTGTGCVGKQSWVLVEVCGPSAGENSKDPKKGPQDSRVSISIVLRKSFVMSQLCSLLPQTLGGVRFWQRLLIGNLRSYVSLIPGAVSPHLYSLKQPNLVENQAFPEEANSHFLSKGRPQRFSAWCVCFLSSSCAA